MIIAFYPGAGGNRYRQLLLGNDWKTLETSYDLANSEYLTNRYLLEKLDHNNVSWAITHCMNSNVIRKLFPNNPIVMINSDLQTGLRREWVLNGHKLFTDKKIKSTVPRLEHYNAIKDPNWPVIYTEDQIAQLPNDILQEVIINYKKITNPQFGVPYKLNNIAQNLVDKINSAYEIINWHIDYYQKMPLDFSQAEKVIDIAADEDEFSLLMQQELRLYPSEIFDQVWNSVVNE
jgi:hypothetical protein